jgi:hypothetical protein
LVLDDNQRPIHARAADDRFATNWSARCGGIGRMLAPNSERAGDSRTARGLEPNTTTLPTYHSDPARLRAALLSGEKESHLLAVGVAALRDRRRVQPVRVLLQHPLELPWEQHRYRLLGPGPALLRRGSAPRAAVGVVAARGRWGAFGRGLRRAGGGAAESLLITASVAQRDRLALEVGDGLVDQVCALVDAIARSYGASAVSPGPGAVGGGRYGPGDGVRRGRLDRGAAVRLQAIRAGLNDA